MKFKFYIDGLRYGHEISTRELSKLTGISRSYLMRMEKDNSDANPSLAIIHKIAKVFGVKPHKLYELIDDESENYEEGDTDTE